MATIVRHVATGTRFVLLGAGYGAHRSDRGQPLFGFGADVDEGEHPMVCVCTDAGKVGFLPADDVVVESVDGVAPGTLLDR